MERIQKKALEEFDHNGKKLLGGYIRPILTHEKPQYISILKNCDLWKEEDPFALTAFGDVLATDKEGYIILFKLLDGISTVICADAELFFLLLNDTDYQKDYFDLDTFEYAKNNVGILNDDECYTYEPIPALGGSKKRETLGKGKMIEYLQILISAM